MKHWDATQGDEAVPLRLSRRDRRHLVQFFDTPLRPSREPTPVASMIGLVLALGLLAGLAWALAPGDVVSSKLVN